MKPDEFDPEIERRLRGIAAGPQPDAPASLYRHIANVARGGTTRRLNGVELTPLRPAGRGRAGFREAGILAGIAAVLIVAVALAGVMVATRGPQVGSTWQPRTDVGTGEWTGLEWHDITATAGSLAPNGGTWFSGIAGSDSWFGSGVNRMVAWRGGYAMLGGDSAIYLSANGITWTSSKGPNSGWLVPVGKDRDLLAIGTEADAPVVLLTSDGVTWTQVATPFSGISSLIPVAGDPGVVVVTNTSFGSAIGGPSEIYFSPDGKTWTKDALPADLAAARGLTAAGGVTVSALVGGFVAVGLISDPNGDVGYSVDGGPESRYSYRSWLSRDGLTWSTYDPAVPLRSSSDPQWSAVQTGRLGSSDGLIYSTDSGVSWQADSDFVASWFADYQAVSDGNRIVMAAGDGSAFDVGEGDGHWTRLEQGGDVASLPSHGGIVLLRSGVLWISSTHVYFGQALSGVAPRGSIGPPTTPSPEPILTFPTSTPAILETAAPTTPPTAFPSASTVTTPGTTDGLTGFTWAPGQGSMQ